MENDKFTVTDQTSHGNTVSILLNKILQMHSLYIHQYPVVGFVEMCVHRKVMDFISFNI